MRTNVCRRIGNELERTRWGPFVTWHKELLWHFPGRTEGNHKWPQSGQLVSWVRCKPITSRIWIYLTTLSEMLLSEILEEQIFEVWTGLNQYDWVWLWDFVVMVVMFHKSFFNSWISKNSLGITVFLTLYSSPQSHLWHWTFWRNLETDIRKQDIWCAPHWGWRSRRGRTSDQDPRSAVISWGVQSTSQPQLQVSISPSSAASCHWPIPQTWFLCFPPAWC